MSTDDPQHPPTSLRSSAPRTTIKFARFPNEKHEVAVLDRDVGEGTVRIPVIAWGVVTTPTGDRVVPFVASDVSGMFDGGLVPATDLTDVVGVYAVGEDTRWVEELATEAMRAELSGGAEKPVGAS